MSIISLLLCNSHLLFFVVFMSYFYLHNRPFKQFMIKTENSPTEVEGMDYII